MLGIVYHQVKKLDKKFKNENFLNIENFKKKINFFKKKYNFFDCKKLLNEKNFKKNDIFLTFDDGLKCHFEYVFPLMKSNRINGIFYIPSMPITKGRILSVHKIHLLIGKINFNQLKQIVEKNLSKKIINENEIKKFKNFTYRTQEKNEITKLKRILNYGLKSEYRTSFINKIFKYFFPTLNEKKFAKNYYLSESDIKKLINNNMLIGAHSMSHQVLSMLRTKEFKDEIDKSLDFINQFTNLKLFSYPYGSKLSYNQKDSRSFRKKKCFLLCKCFKQKYQNR